MKRDMRLRPRPREPRRRPLTDEQVRQVLDELDSRPATGKHAQEEEQ